MNSSKKSNKTKKMNAIGDVVKKLSGIRKRIQRKREYAQSQWIIMNFCRGVGLKRREVLA